MWKQYFDPVYVILIKKYDGKNIMISLKNDFF